MKKLFKIIGVIAAIFLVLIIVLFALLWYWSTLPMVKEGYYENTVTGGEIEAKYTLKGSYEVASAEHDAEDDTVGKYEIWYPAEMETSGKTYPLVVMVNGTGVPASKYEAVFRSSRVVGIYSDRQRGRIHLYRAFIFYEP